MIPLNSLSSTTIPDRFLGGRNSKRINNKLDFEDGGIGLNDPSMGNEYQVWFAWLATEGVYVSADNWAATLIYEGSEISEISFTFDQNCRPCLAFVQRGIPKLQWYDSVAQSQVITLLDPKTQNPRVSLDDKRIEAIKVNDIILAYLREGNLCYRQQRDRFLIEYILKTGVGGRLNKIGMGVGLRMQFQICKA